jgi:hypothetical protein
VSELLAGMLAAQRKSFRINGEFANQPNKRVKRPVPSSPVQSRPVQSPQLLTPKVSRPVPSSPVQSTTLIVSRLLAGARCSPSIGGVL